MYFGDQGGIVLQVGGWGRGFRNFFWGRGFWCVRGRGELVVETFQQRYGEERIRIFYGLDGLELKVEGGGEFGGFGGLWGFGSFSGQYQGLFLRVMRMVGVFIRFGSGDERNFLGGFFFLREMEEMFQDFCLVFLGQFVRI